MSKRKTTKEFIKDSNYMHNNKYDYSKVEYINCRTKVCIICPNHGEFRQTPNSHLSGQGCSKCGGNKPYNTLSFIQSAKKIHNNNYDYSKVEYINNKTKVCIICPVHGEFWQKPDAHLKGQRCETCFRNFRKTNQEFIKEAQYIHDLKYDYSLVQYKNNKTKVCIICPDHGEFMQTPKSHLNGRGCPTCKQSHAERIISQWLTNNNIHFIWQKKFKNCKNKKVLPFDFYLPNFNMCIEYDGEQHYNEQNKYFTEDIIKNDNIKTNFCIKNNIELIRIRGIKNLYERMQNLLKFDEIDSIEEIDNKLETIDIKVNGGLFYANGILTHNSGFGNSEIDLTNVSDSIGTAATADIIIGVTQSEDLRRVGRFSWIILKNRYGLNKRLVPVSVDYYKMRVYECEESEVTGVASSISKDPPNSKDKKKKVTDAVNDVKNVLKKDTNDKFKKMIDFE